MRFAALLILLGINCAFGEPLKISIPYQTPPGNPIEDEMIPSPPPILERLAH